MVECVLSGRLVRWISPELNEPPAYAGDSSFDIFCGSAAVAA